MSFCQTLIHVLLCPMKPGCISVHKFILKQKLIRSTLFDVHEEELMLAIPFR